MQAIREVIESREVISTSICARRLAKHRQEENTCAASWIEAFGERKITLKKLLGVPDHVIRNVGRRVEDSTLSLRRTSRCRSRVFHHRRPATRPMFLQDVWK